MNKFSLLLNLLLVPILFSAQNKTQPSLEKLRTEIETLKSDSDLVHSSWSICVMQTKTGEMLAEYNSKISLVPASTQKIATTAAGLSLLGPNYTYQTILEYDGVFDSLKGIIKGNLYIKGSGDPTLGSEYFMDKNDTVSIVKKWAATLKARGIKSVEGAVIADASAFDEETVPVNWIWGDMGNYYGAGASGLTFMDNLFRLYYKSGKTGDSTGITKIVPDIPGLKITNYVKAGGSEDDAYIFGAPYNSARYVTGTIPPFKTDFDVKGSMPDPPYFLAYQTKLALLQNGILVTGPATSVRQLKLESNYKSKPRKKLLSTSSPSLEKIVYWTNQVSNNLFAEHVLKTIALQRRGYGSESGGIDEVIKFWKAKGLDTKGMNLTDGCGLARANTITARQLAELFRIMTKDAAYNAFYNSLPIAGKTGTMRNMGKGTIAENNVRAKGGSFNRVRSLAGYATNKKGEQICFSIILNNFDCSGSEIKKKLERLIVLIAELD